MGMLARWAHRVIARRGPDFVIGSPDRPYLRRWWIIPRNPIFNIYLHQILRSDDDRALHDHPWINATVMIEGGYHEHVIAAGGIHRRVYRSAQKRRIKVRLPSAAHRLEVGAPALTLFITGPRLRQWGFHCPESGWRHWRDFTGGERGELIGRGCGE